MVFVLDSRTKTLLADMARKNKNQVINRKIMIPLDSAEWDLGHGGRIAVKRRGSTHRIGKLNGEAFETILSDRTAANAVSSKGKKGPLVFPLVPPLFILNHLTIFGNQRPSQRIDV